MSLVIAVKGREEKLMDVQQRFIETYILLKGN
jgi:hypothetical protein